MCTKSILLHVNISPNIHSLRPLVNCLEVVFVVFHGNSQVTYYLLEEVAILKMWSMRFKMTRSFFHSCFLLQVTSPIYASSVARGFRGPVPSSFTCGNTQGRDRLYVPSVARRTRARST